MTATDNPQLHDATTQMFGVTVDLEFTHDHGEVVSSCWLSIAIKDGHFNGRYAGSLPLCESILGIPYEPGTGPDNGPERYPLTDSQLDAIQQWADAHGY